MNATLSLTNSYWEILKSLSDDVKLLLASRLTASVVKGIDVGVPCVYSVEELQVRVRQATEDARQGLGTTTEDLMLEATSW